jgi:hypothetical protein
MNKFYTLILLVISSVAIAQPTFNSSSFFTIGTTYNYQDITSTSLAPGSAGANQTWNFGSLTPGSNPYSNQFISPAGAPGSSNFPGATVVGVVGTPPNSTYAYYTNSSASAQINGLYTNAGGTPFSIVYNNPQTVVNYPLTYASTGSDNFSSSYTTTFSGFTVNQYQNGNISYVADGYGTLTTPAGTYSNCLRVKYRQVQFDSTVYVGIPIPPAVSNRISTTYTFFSLTNGKLVDRFSMSFDTTDAQGTITTSESANYATSITTGLSTLNAPKIANLDLFPNPSSGQTTLSLYGGKLGNANLVITDLTGKLIRKEEIEIVSDFKYNINVEELKAGLYLVSVSQQDKLWAGQFVKY